MSSEDERRRKKAREAKMMGDEVAVQAEEAKESRTLSGPYDHLLGRWVTIYGVRAHYRGRLLRVIHGNICKLHFDVLYNMNDISTTQGENKLPASVEFPYVVVETAIHDIGPQLDGLPEH